MPKPILSFCTQCGYNLTSTTYSFCPSCGEDISQGGGNRLKWTSDFLGHTFKAITHGSSSIPIGLIKNIANGIDDDIEKIPIRSILKRIADSTSDPRVVEITKSLAKNSPKFAIAIAAAALTAYGIPAAPLLAPLAQRAAKQIITTPGTTGSSTTPNGFDMVEYVSLVTNAIGKISEQQRRP
jgi:hypothetical protein